MLHHVFTKNSEELRMYYGTCQVQAIVPGKVPVRNLAEPKFLNGPTSCTWDIP